MGLFDKMKNFVGIDTVGVEVVVTESLSSATESINGTVIITGKSEQTVKRIIVNLIEKYKYKNQENSIVTSDYQLGEITLEEEFKIAKDEIKKIAFNLPVKTIEDKGFYSKEEIEKMKNNKLSKYIVENTSTYFISAVADVEAAKIDPAGRAEVSFK